jgi:MFS family permease
MDRDGLSVVPEAAPGLDPPYVASAARPSSGSGTFRALHSKPFRIYFAGQIASASGTFLQQTAIGWLVFQLTGSATSLGLVLAVGGLPSLLLGPWGGSLADRVDLRRLLIVTQSVFAVLAAVLWFAGAVGAGSVGLVIAINVVGGFVSVVDSPARQAFVSRLVPPEDLASAVSLNGVVMNSARVVGPAVAGVLIVTVGTTPCFAVNAVSYAAVIGALALVGLLAFNFAVILPVLARQTFHGSGGTYGLLSTMLSLGSIAGSLGVGFLHHPRRVYLMAASLAFGGSLIATALAPDVAVACVTLAVTGAAAFSFVTLCSTTLQLHSAPAYRGRIMALWVFVYVGTTPIGSALTGWITSAAGPRAALLVGAAS